MAAQYDDDDDETGAQIPSSSIASNVSSEAGGIKAGRFPLELYRMLDTVSSMDLDKLVCWQDDGKSFMIHNKPEFERAVMPM